MRWNTSGLLSLLRLPLLHLFAALWLLQFSLVHSSFMFIFSSWHCSHKSVFLAFHPTILFLGRHLSPFTSLYLRQIYKQLSKVCGRWRSRFDLQSSVLPLYRCRCLNSGCAIDLLPGLDRRSNSPAPYSNERGMECVCACACVLKPCLSGTFIPQAAAISLSCVSSGCVQHLSDLLFYIGSAQPWIHAASLNLSGCKCLNCTNRQQLLWCLSVCVRACVCAQVQDCLCLSFMFNPSFMQSDLSHRAPSVQPEGWISNALLKPLLGSLHTHAGSHSYKYTLKESRCVSDC